LANAFLATWVYVKGVKRTATLPSPGDAKSTDVVDGTGVVTSNAIHVFNGPANGNIIKRSTGLTDGKCLFPNHQVVRVGSKYYDPTFNLATAVTAYDAVVIKYRLMKPNSAVMLYRTLDGRHLYAHNLVRAPQFSDSWIEMNGTLRTPLNEWMVQTSRVGHTRSESLKAVDAAMGNFEKQGMPAYLALKRAVQDWKVKDSSEFQARDRATGCVTKLKTLLGI
jgi:hypothetical protein